MWPASSRAADAAAWAITDTENVVRIRLKYPISSAGPNPSPTRTPAKPCAFEQVRKTTTLRPCRTYSSAHEYSTPPGGRSGDGKYDEGTFAADCIATWRK